MRNCLSYWKHLLSNKLRSTPNPATNCFDLSDQNGVNNPISSWSAVTGVAIGAYHRLFATHQRARPQPFCSASGVGVTGFCPRTRPGVQQAALEDTRCRHQHLLRQVSRVTYDSYVVHCNILAAFYLQSITSSFPLVIRSNEQQPRSTPWDDLSFHCKDARTTPPTSVYTLELPGTIMFLRTKNLWRVKAYKSQFCAMHWAVRSTIKNLLKVTLLSFASTVPYHLYFMANSWRC